MQVHFKPFYIQKAGNAESEYEDAFYPEKARDLKDELLRFAIADGATEALLSGEWAGILVKSFARCDSKTLPSEILLAQSSDRWQKRYADYLRKRESGGRPIQWYEEEGLNAGPFCAFLGLTFKDSQDACLINWTALALGDACLFQIRSDKLVASFPMDMASEFNSRPLLVSPKARESARVLEAMKHMDGTCQPDDQIYLMTDALGCWFLKQYEKGELPWKILRDLDTTDQAKPFRGWVEGLRVAGEIRNDDVTLIRIDIW